MTRQLLDLLAGELDHYHDESPARPRQPKARRGGGAFSRQWRRPGVPLGMNARGARRSTYSSLTRGKVRVLPVLHSGTNVANSTSSSVG